MKKPELLAPAGSFESLIAAINAGCDAVYLSGYMFGARQFAPNFSREELIKAIEICHTYSVKVYVTVNTLIYEEEVNTFLDYIDFLHKNNVDAIIVQDIGMIDLVRQTYPNLEIHASTQMHIHNLEGVKFCEKLGIKRIVLARETNIETISEIRKNTNIELEVFIHGALCVSYSGQCLMSSLIGGRSGNRGACAGTCRLPYKLLDQNNNKLNENDYVLSMKDLCSLENITTLIESGIDSFKIEGRMKRPEYVYLVVSLYRKAIDSYFNTGKVKIDEEELKDLKKVFNREFTKGFLFNESNNNITNDYRPNHLGINIGSVISTKNKYITIKLTDTLSVGDGIRIIDSDVGCTVTNIFKNNQKVTTANQDDIVSIKIDGEIKSGSTVVKTTDANQLKLLHNKITDIDKKIPIDGTITLLTNNKIVLELNDGLNTVQIEHGIVQEAKNAPLSNENILKQISKLGETPFILNSLTINKDENIFVNNKDLNEIRRQAVELLIKKRIYSTHYKEEQYEKSVPNFEHTKELNVLLEDSNLYNNIKDLKINHIYIDDINLMNNNDPRLVLKIPRVINKFDDYNYPLLVGEIGSLTRKNIYASDFSLNVTNSYAVAFLHSIGIPKIVLSYELNFDQIKRIINNYKNRYHKNPNLELIVYGREEMMVSKFSLNKKYNQSKLKLIDRYNKIYPVKEKNNLMYIYNCNIRNIENINDYYNIGINSLRYNLYDKKDCEKLVKIY